MKEAKDKNQNSTDVKNAHNKSGALQNTGPATHISPAVSRRCLSVLIFFKVAITSGDSVGKMSLKCDWKKETRQRPVIHHLTGFKNTTFMCVPAKKNPPRCAHRRSQNHAFSPPVQAFTLREGAGVVLDLSNISTQRFDSCPVGRIFTAVPPSSRLFVIYVDL